jgi:hypothetical protein
VATRAAPTITRIATAIKTALPKTPTQIVPKFTPVGQNPASEAGIYKFAASSGKPYIGQSINIANRIDQHAASGKYPGGSVSTINMPNATSIELRIQEQIQINAAGGPDKLENAINSVAAKFWDDLNIPPPLK